MDQRTAEVLSSLGISPESVPAGCVRVLHKSAYQGLSEGAAKWARDRRNGEAVAYEVETEHRRGAGLLLRNLRSGPDRASYTIAEGDGPFWHNWTPALPFIWATGVIVLVEGPKDARVCHAEGVAAVAYLGAVPSSGHLRCAARYAHTAVWIPDNDVRMDPAVARRRAKVAEQAAAAGIRLREVRCAAKDPAECAGRPEEWERLRRIWREASMLGGGGAGTPGEQAFRCGRSISEVRA